MIPPKSTIMTVVDSSTASLTDANSCKTDNSRILLIHNNLSTVLAFYSSLSSSFCSCCCWRCSVEFCSCPGKRSSLSQKRDSSFSTERKYRSNIHGTRLCSDRERILAHHSNNSNGKRSSVNNESASDTHTHKKKRKTHCSQKPDCSITRGLLKVLFLAGFGNHKN